MEINETQTQIDETTLLADQTNEVTDEQSQNEELILENKSDYRYWVYIDGVDYSDKISWDSFQLNKSQNRVPAFSFNIADQDTNVDMLSDVVFYLGETPTHKLFGGVITRTSESYDGLYRRLQVECQGYEFLLNSKLVVGEFSGTVTSVVKEVVEDYGPAGFTTKGVEYMSEEINQARFNHEKLSEVLNTIADNYNMSWYVTPDKDIRFFTTRNAPFGLTDTNGRYDWRSLRVQNDIEDLANSIIVRGGFFVEENESEESLNNQVDGDSNVYKLGFRYQNPQLFVDGVEKSVGVLNLHSFDNYFALYSDREKNISVETPLEETDKPVVFKGNRKVPVRNIRSDNTSILKYGQTFQSVVIDDSIEDQEDGRQRALAELTKYSDELSDIEFTTKQDGLNIGDVIKVESDIRSLDEEYVVNSIKVNGYTPTRLSYKIDGVLRRKKDFIDTMKDLLRDRKDRIGIGEDEALEFLIELNETNSWTDSFETDPWGTDQIPVWVAGPYVPTNSTDQKRAPRTDSGALTT